MASRRPARSSGARRRGRLLGAVLGSALAVLLVAAGSAVARHVLDGRSHRLDSGALTSPATRATFASSPRWPQQGEAALVLGAGRPAASPSEEPQPIASLAKVMTAYL